MTPTIQADKLEVIGRLRFTSAQWWKESPHFVLLRYSIDGQEKPTGIRLDLDKRAVLDSVGYDELDKAIRERTPKIWQAIVKERFASDIQT